MTLLELSVQYHAQAAALRERVAQLRARQERSWDENERLQLADRIRLLQAMQREARELAALTEHYYERGYWRNVKYTL
ncbi:hypothetical protein [Lawsonibacter celer]|jgi:hypothetical protein|uniref:hypothetical protein n=1 Tax=Lawsonibacter celer TaxID=2986526 RepID=UPI0016484381|nr:hypothetical protein [Lawsonibacter celer]